MGTRPTTEFRSEAVRLALTSGLPSKQVASDLGVGFLTLNRWIQQDSSKLDKPVAQTDLEREVAELRKEVRLLKKEKGIIACPIAVVQSECQDWLQFRAAPCRVFVQARGHAGRPIPLRFLTANAGRTQTPTLKTGGHRGVQRVQR